MRRRSGFTLIEMLVTLVVLGILTSIALPSFRDLVARHRIKDAATDLYVALAKARSEAVKRNASVTLTPKPGGWQAGWQLADAGGVVLDVGGALNGVSITGGPASIVYRSSGRIQGNVDLAFAIASVSPLSFKQCVYATVSGRPYVRSC